MHPLTCEIIPATEDEAKFVDNKLDVFNENYKPFTRIPTPLSKNYIIKEKEKIIAGINSLIYYDTMYVGVLFVNEDYRHKGFGSALLHKVETEAKAMGVHLIHLDTFEFQALDFYLKHGYEVFGVLDDCPWKGHTRYYLKKTV